MAAPDPRQSEAEARVGTVVRERWRLDTLLGIGGMASVYAATHRNGSRVALKILHRMFRAEGSVRERFLREGYLANKIGHPGVVRVLDDDVTAEGDAVLVMELLHGKTLDAHVASRGGTVAPQEALAIADQMLEVLAAAHDAGVVHRDIKPPNVFFTREGRVKLLDFGLARAMELSTGMTLGGVVLGTPAFLAPEQARGQWNRVGPRSDLWAVGATTVFAIGGHEIHTGPTTAAVLVAAATQTARPASELCPGLSPRIASALDRALAFEVEDRFEDARTMQRALREAYATLEVSSMHVVFSRVAPPSKEPPPSDPPRSSWSEAAFEPTDSAHPKKLASTGAAATPPVITTPGPAPSPPAELPAPPLPAAEPGESVSAPRASLPPSARPVYGDSDDESSIAALRVARPVPVGVVVGHRVDLPKPERPPERPPVLLYALAVAVFLAVLGVIWIALQ